MVGPRVQKIAAVSDRLRGSEPPGPFCFGGMGGTLEPDSSPSGDYRLPPTTASRMENQTGSTLRAGERLTPAGGAAASRFLPRQGTAGSAASWPSSPEGVGTLGEEGRECRR